MTRTLTILAAATLLAAGLGAAALAQHDEGEATTPHYPILEPPHVDWSFAGPFGRFDPQQLQRGFHIYRDVCSGCHSLNLVAFRTLAAANGPHFSEEEVAALAAEYPNIIDGPNDAGEMFERPGRPSDRLPGPYANEQQARSLNQGAYPPDLSLIAKARAVERGFPTFIFDIFTQYQELGPDYIHALLTGYQDPPEGVEIPEGQYYNPYFIAGPSLAMPPPLHDGDIAYAQNQDETEVNDVPATVDQYARDVTAFLMWAAEPHMVERKQLGLTVMIFLIVLAGLVYYTKKKVWAYVPGEGAA
jgi:ubiquinol-cytochrome c reductase cytochrome c1 subunit